MCFSRILPLIPLTVPKSSTTTTWISSFLADLSLAYDDVAGFDAISFQEMEALVRPNV